MKKKNGTQHNRILKYLQDFNTITSAQAMSDLGVYRLSARISELKSQGYAIRTRTITETNRYGEKVRFAEYSLEEYEGKAE